MVAGAWSPLLRLHGTEASLFQHRTLIALATVILFSALRATPSGAAAVTLIWTAPGDDGNVGRAYSYEMRYSTAVVTAQNFASATRVQGLPSPTTPGLTQSFTLDGLQAGVTHYFALRTVDMSGNWSSMSNVVALVPREIASDPFALGLSFSPPMPNPARDAARFSCVLPGTTEVRVEAFDLSGRLVRTLMDGTRGAGAQELVWDLRDERGYRLSGGVYLVRARLGETVFIRRLVVVR